MMTISYPIALLTDFGLQDSYVGILKGVIATIHPKARIIDISHQIPAQNLSAGRFCLMNAYPYFPHPTIYVAVVDPGVGTERSSIAVKLRQGYYVGPDNGLISGILTLDSAIMAVKLTNSRYWRASQPSSTFHGRDIFAPVAAHLSKGVALEELGSEIPVERLQTLPIPKIQLTPTQIRGSIQYIDGFGNLITNVHQDNLSSLNWTVTLNHQIIPQGITYASVKPSELVALIGSHGWLEIAANAGNAQEKLGVEIGDPIVINLEP